MKRTVFLLLAVVLLAASMSPIALAAEVCYPSVVEESEDGGEIRKVYDLSPEQDPAGIPRSDFEQQQQQSHCSFHDVLLYIFIVGPACSGSGGRCTCVSCSW